ncbi:helix-turn-helix domain-containing protein [Acidicapsa dinghuensis]|uniref:Helix-turn-helix domain-containing protein n=1 Tax=Acidicapsa dinghuensis TaxID=2218256 RepID=A0ABW1EI02_9BACT|nr:helix-turn-helix transcriptional regulator [Acidicapsa dinghuensis]
MATTVVTMPLTMPAREVLRCEHCQLVQFRTSNSMCRRCHKALDMEEAPAPIAMVPAVDSDSEESDAGLRVASQVKEIRKARHLSQRQLASRMQVPRTYISKIENGKAIPTLGSLERLAYALEVDICHLVRDGRGRREEETAQILADPFLAEIAQYLPRLEPLQRSLLLNQVRDRAREAAREQALGKRRTA